MTNAKWPEPQLKEAMAMREYCRTLTDNQVREVVKKEFHANRLHTAHAAVFEAERRGLVRQYNVPLDQIFD